MTEQGLEDRIIAHLSDVQSHDLPDTAVETAKRCLVDTLGVAIAGSTGEGVSKLVNWLESRSRVGNASVLVYGSRLSASDAAWAHGAMARAHEFDDSHDPTGDHPSVPIFAAAVAAAQDAGPVNGRDFLAAYVLAADIVARLRLAPVRKVGGTAFAANTYAPFSAAVAAARIFGLRNRSMYDAVAWAYSQAAGSVQLQQGGNSALHIHHGLAASSGVQAAQLARQGFPGMEGCLTGKFGLYNAYEGGIYDADVITDRLGERFETTSIAMKHYPSGRVTHGPIEAALQLRAEGTFAVEEIEAVDVAYTQGGYNMTCEPLEDRRAPTCPQHAKFSLNYNVACALVRGHVDLSDFTHEAVSSMAIRSLAEKVRVTVDSKIQAVIPPGLVTLHFRDGRQETARIDALAGSIESPPSFADAAEKARRCAQHAVREVDVEQLEALISAIDALEEVDDVGSLFAQPL